MSLCGGKHSTAIHCYSTWHHGEISRERCINQSLLKRDFFKLTKGYAILHADKSLFTIDAISSAA